MAAQRPRAKLPGGGGQSLSTLPPPGGQDKQLHGFSTCETVLGQLGVASPNVVGRGTPVKRPVRADVVVDPLPPRERVAERPKAEVSQWVLLFRVPLSRRCLRTPTFSVRNTLLLLARGDSLQASRRQCPQRWK